MLLPGAADAMPARAKVARSATKIDRRRIFFVKNLEKACGAWSIDGPSQRAQEHRGSRAMETCLSASTRAHRGSRSRHLAKHGGVATAFGAVLLELARSVPHSLQAEGTGTFGWAICLLSDSI